MSKIKVLLWFTFSEVAMTLRKANTMTKNVHWTKLLTSRQMHSREKVRKTERGKEEGG